MRKFTRLAVGAALASLALAAPAAQATPPAPPYADFAGCPTPAEDPAALTCTKVVFPNGHIQFGKKNVPVTNPIVLRGAIQQITGEFVHTSEGGIVPVQQTLDGGLIGITGFQWLDELLSTKDKLKVFVTVEQAGQPAGLEEFPISLPVKLHLQNPLLGSNCYVGSNAAPIQLSLGTGTTSPPLPNQPITGKKAAKFAPEPERPEVLTAKGGTLVDNAFATPAANGCVLKLGPFGIPIDEVVDAAAGLPAAAGTNEAVLGYDFSIVSQEVVFP
ncbi:MAG TPA: hypothetical protein VF081_12340 [Solirubrobacterales bacterium]